MKDMLDEHIFQNSQITGQLISNVIFKRLCIRMEVLPNEKEVGHNMADIGSHGFIYFIVFCMENILAGYTVVYL